MKSIFLLPILFLIGCATIIEGTTQSISVVTFPTGAFCEISQNGKVIAHINSTPEIINVEKSRHYLTTSCQKSGYVASISFTPSEVTLVTLGNIVTDGPIGIVIDASTGADFKYQNEIYIRLNPISQ